MTRANFVAPFIAPFIAAAALPVARSLRVFFLAALAVLAGCALHRSDRNAARLPWDDAAQLVLVVTPDWNATQGELRAWSRAADGWHSAGDPIPVVVGRPGSAWGIGLHPAQAGTQKREGDGRSPAGVFAIGTAFGYAGEAATSLPYRALTADDWCIDVDGSPLYNQIVDARTVGSAAIRGSTEPMRRDLHADGDQAYKLGFVVAHNPQARPAAGSCIFVHLWKSPDSTTSGCTAMTEAALRRLLDWLSPAAHPAFVLLPQAEYERLRADWHLPAGGAS